MFVRYSDIFFFRPILWNIGTSTRSDHLCSAHILGFKKFLNRRRDLPEVVAEIHQKRPPLPVYETSTFTVIILSCQTSSRVINWNYPCGQPPHLALSNHSILVITPCRKICTRGREGGGGAERYGKRRLGSKRGRGDCEWCGREGGGTDVRTITWKQGKEGMDRKRDVGWNRKEEEEIWIK